MKLSSGYAPTPPRVAAFQTALFLKRQRAGGPLGDAAVSERHVGGDAARAVHVEVLAVRRTADGVVVGAGAKARVHGARAILLAQRLEQVDAELPERGDRRLRDAGAGRIVAVELLDDEMRREPLAGGCDGCHVRLLVDGASNEIEPPAQP
jgi:hypothetical protein